MNKSKLKYLLSRLKTDKKKHKEIFDCEKNKDCYSWTIISSIIESFENGQYAATIVDVFGADQFYIYADSSKNNILNDEGEVTVTVEVNPRQHIKRVFEFAEGQRSNGSYYSFYDCLFGKSLDLGMMRKNEILSRFDFFIERLEFLLKNYKEITADKIYAKFYEQATGQKLFAVTGENGETIIL